MIPRSFCSFSSFSGVLFRLYVKLVFGFIRNTAQLLALRFMCHLLDDALSAFRSYWRSWHSVRFVLLLNNFVSSAKVWRWCCNIPECRSRRLGKAHVQISFVVVGPTPDTTFDHADICCCWTTLCRRFVRKISTIKVVFLLCRSGVVIVLILDLLPFLKIGLTCASFQFCGSVCSSNYFCIIIASGLLISLLSSFRTRGCSPSGPCDLCGFKNSNIFFTFSSVIVSSSSGFLMKVRQAGSMYASFNGYSIGSQAFLE